MTCPHCNEPVEEPLDCLPNMRNYHRECVLRMVFGSVAHIEGRCSCFVAGSAEDDPPGVSVRQAARLAVEAFERRQGSNIQSEGQWKTHEHDEFDGNGVLRRFTAD